MESFWSAVLRRPRSSLQVSYLLSLALICQFILIGSQADTRQQQQPLLLREQPLGLSLHKLLATISILNMGV